MGEIRGRRGSRGATLVETALILPALAVIVFGVVDLGRAYQLQIRLDGAAREGATHAQLSPNDVSCGGSDDIEGRAAEAEPDLVNEPGYAVTVLAEDAGGNLTVPVTGCGSTTVDAGERVRVEVVATFQLLTPLVGGVVGDTILLTGSNEIEVLG
ncbi:MAG: TadE/TadG family type IV pilus assembly protein [Acidimicrobiales bacterium]|nr:TadE/TadG family type IV pilus assembly protein [Acidimicrobiales bacterium]